MERELVIKKCLKCGAMVEVIEDCRCENCGIKCCGEQMVAVKPNSVDCTIENHKPQYEVVGNYIEVSVNHEMKNEHHIEWIALDCEKLTAKKYFSIGESPKAVFSYIKGSKIYAYCNKHCLWVTEVK